MDEGECVSGGRRGGEDPGDAGDGPDETGVLAPGCERFFDAADVVCLVLDADGNVDLANERACELLGYDRADLVGTDWFETCVPERIRGEVRGVFDRLMDGDVDSAGRHENVVVTADGDERVVSSYGGDLTVPDDDREGATVEVRLPVAESERVD